MFKKLSKVFLILGLTISLAAPVYAHENTNVATEVITEDTIITEENVYEVLKYLNIDSDNYTKGDSVGQTFQTVGELEGLLQLVKTHPQKNKPQTIKPEMNFETANNVGVFSSSGTKMLYLTSDFDGYELDFKVAGNFRGTMFTGVGAQSVSLKYPPVILFYKIDDEDISATFTSSKIQMDATVTIGTYVGIGPGSVRIGSHEAYVFHTWFANEEL